MSAYRPIRNIILAIDSFKGCLSSFEANSAAANGLKESLHGVKCVNCTVSDGGEGWLDAWQKLYEQDESPTADIKKVEAVVSDPLMRHVQASYL